MGLLGLRLVFEEVLGKELSIEFALVKELFELGDFVLVEGVSLLKLFDLLIELIGLRLVFLEI